MSTMTDERVITEDDVRTSNDKPESAHIVMVPPGEPDESPHAYVMRARIEGFPVTALCGYTCIPWRSAAGLPVCRACARHLRVRGSQRREWRGIAR